MLSCARAIFLFNQRLPNSGSQATRTGLSTGCQGLPFWENSEPVLSGIGPFSGIRSGWASAGWSGCSSAMRARARAWVPRMLSSTRSRANTSVGGMVARAASSPSMVRSRRRTTSSGSVNDAKSTPSPPAPVTWTVVPPLPSATAGGLSTSPLPMANLPTKNVSTLRMTNNRSGATYGARWPAR